MKQFLFVGNHAVFREGLALLIAPRLGYPDVQAGTLDDARRILADSESEIGLLIVDLDLPGGDAVELIEELRNSVKDASVLAFTYGRSSRVRSRALQAGADEVLTLHASVQRFLDTAARLGGVTERKERQEA